MLLKNWVLKSWFFANAIQNKASRRIKEKTGCRYVRTEPRKFLNPEFTECENMGTDKRGLVSIL